MKRNLSLVDGSLGFAITNKCELYFNRLSEEQIQELINDNMTLYDEHVNEMREGWGPLNETQMYQSRLAYRQSLIAFVEEWQTLSRDEEKHGLRYAQQKRHMRSSRVAGRE